MKNVKFLVVFLIMAFTISGTVQAQRNKKFDPKRFEADMEQFIVTEAGLSMHESAVFFPLFRQLQRKQRLIFDEMNRYRHTDLKDNVASAKAIERMDASDLEIKKLQQLYHKKFMKVLPAGKVLQIIKAEDKFHRRAFKNAFKKREDNK